MTSKFSQALEIYRDKGLRRLIIAFIRYFILDYRTRASYNKTILPKEAEDYLHPDNYRLKKLMKEYSRFDPAVTDPLIWVTDHVKPDDIKYFRGDNAYVWQLRGGLISEINYILTAYYVKTIDNLGLLNILKEDDNFGIYTFSFDDNKLISRDLLDSIVEIYFLERQLNISTFSKLNILDIGAGYGRLAHRFVEALPNLSNYICVDAIPVSTFICEYYLSFRKVNDKAKAVPIYEIEDILSNQPIDIAVNIHSFPECKISSIEWWLSLLVKYKIKYLMIVPNYLEHGRKQLLTNSGEDFLPIIKNKGYKLIAKEPKYRDRRIQKYGIYPSYHYLFELS